MLKAVLQAFLPAESIATELHPESLMLSFKDVFIFLSVCECLACVSVCALCKCLVPTEVINPLETEV